MPSNIPPPMDEATVRADIELFTDAANEPILSTTDIDVLVRKAKRADYMNRPPSDANWYATWNIPYAVAYGWRLKSTRLVGLIKFTSGGTTYSREQFFEHCRQMQKDWMSRSIESIQMVGAWRRKLLNPSADPGITESQEYEDGLADPLSPIISNIYPDDDFLP